MRRLSLFLLGAVLGVFGLSFTFAQNIEIIPEANKSNVISDVEAVGNAGGHVWDEYNKVLDKDRSLEDSLASGIMDWNIILDYFARFVNYLSQLGIFIGACFIVYAGYVYATSIFNGGDTKKGKEAIKNALLGVVIITFSYAIMKAVMAAFL